MSPLSVTVVTYHVSFISTQSSMKLPESASSSRMRNRAVIQLLISLSVPSNTSATSLWCCRLTTVQNSHISQRLTDHIPWISCASILGLSISVSAQEHQGTTARLKGAIVMIRSAFITTWSSTPMMTSNCRWSVTYNVQTLSRCRPWTGDRPLRNDRNWW